MNPNDMTFEQLVDFVMNQTKADIQASEPIETSTGKVFVGEVREFFDTLPIDIEQIGPGDMGVVAVACAELDAQAALKLVNLIIERFNFKPDGEGGMAF
jgi:hypothetical protein